MSGLDVKFLIRVISFCAEYGVVLFFFSPLESRNGRKCWPAYLCLALIVILYFPPDSPIIAAENRSTENLIVQSLRLVYYWAAVSGYLCLSKRIQYPVGMYLAAFYTPFYTVGRGLNVILSYMRTAIPALSGNEEIHQLWLALLVLVLEFLATHLVHRFVRMDRIQTVDRQRIWTVVLVNLLVLYFKYSVITLQSETEYSIRMGDAVFYPLCFMLGVLAFLILTESLRAEQDNRRAMELEQLSKGYELQNAKRALQTQNDIRRLHHDMKNHLLAIRDLEGNKGDVSAYVDDLLGDMAGYEDSVSTGLPAMDAFLSEKVYRARLEHIDCDVCLDLSPLEFVSQVDLISIFGNAVDNALEAVRKLPEEERVVFLKSNRFANTVLVQFSNPYTGELRKANGKLLTGKDNPAMHGIGLGSIEKAAARYQGNLDVQADETEHLFHLTVMIPIAEQP